MKQRHVLMGVFFGVVVYAAFALWGDGPKLLAAFQRFDAWHGVAAIALVSVGYVFRFWKWQYYLRRLGIEVQWRLSALVFVAGMVMSITPGKVGEVLKSVLLREGAGIEASRTAPVVMMERVTDLLGLCVIAALGVLMFGKGVWPLLICLGLMLLGLGVLSQASWVEGGIAWIEGRGESPRKLAEGLRRAHESLEQLLAWRTLAETTLLSVVSWGLEGVAFWVIIEGLDGSKGGMVVEAMSIFALTTIMGALSFLPGGVGVTEGGMVGLLMWFEIFEVEEMALAATYLIRLATLWYGVALGGLAFAAFRRVHGGERAMPWN